VYISSMMDSGIPFSFKNPFVVEAEEKAREFLSGGGEDIGQALARARDMRTSFSTVVDDFARMSNVPDRNTLARFCRPSTCPLLDTSCLKIPRDYQKIVDGLPALLVCRTPWGALTFITPVPFLDKTGATELLKKQYGALKVSFVYCTTEGLLSVYERLSSGGRFGEGLQQPTHHGVWWNWLREHSLVDGECPDSPDKIFSKLPKAGDIKPELSTAVASLLTNTPYVDFTRSAVEEDLPALAPAIQKHYGVTPISLVGNLCAMACERQLTARERGEISTKGMRVCYVLSDHEKVQQAITDWEARRLSASEIARRIEVDEQKDDHVIEEIDITELVKRSGEDNPTVVELVQSIIVYGIQSNATDIHISTHPTKMWVRFRIDGFLSDYPNAIDTKLSRQVVSRIKIMSNIDTQYSPVPQDGKFSISFQKREFDIRVNTAPTVYGDKAILRILPKRFRLPTLDDLGFLRHERDIVSKVVAADHGMLVICGPTGAGKSTTLSAAIGMIDSNRYVVVTGEQPVEMRIPNIEQTNVTASIDNPNGLTFARFLEAALRQDPDYIMIGETRDMETASQVVRAALTGHVVMTTLHTNSAPTAPGRLIDLGVQPFLLKEALSAVVAQRLLPRLCSNCSISTDPPSEADMKAAGIDPAWFKGESNFAASQGCSVCRGTGYAGRIGIFEGYLVDNDVRRAIGEAGGNATGIREAMRKQGGRTLLEQACYLYAKGITDLGAALTMRSEDEDGH
jgi:type II secretory ATPase GspE/PulE/Tfp pilus assembly ATPase PilB-like protein